MTKKEAMQHWRGLQPGQNPLQYMAPIRPKTRGSRYGCCGIRIDGNPAFVDAVLSCLKPLLDGENHVTRLELARNPVQVRPGYAAGVNADSGAECCYIRLHLRGQEAAAMSAAFDRALDGATERFAAAAGLDEPVHDDDAWACTGPLG